MSKYVYPAVFTEEEDGGYSVEFPDIKGCFSQGEDTADALDAANDALCLMLYHMEKDGKNIPAPSDIREISAGNGFVSLVSCDTADYKKYYDNKAVKKTLSIPSWLNEMAEAEHINFSSLLKEALMAKLNVQ
ncbi:MAG: type II toxin-antitoxin system HicB family antitoxin [Ruminococcus sp.]|nr:type II toxin-antitoxin system HicB family antitoxin [Ruminococcus sp.]